MLYSRELNPASQTVQCHTDAIFVIFERIIQHGNCGSNKYVAIANKRADTGPCLSKH